MVYQISVFLENRAGQFAEITDILAKEGVDLRGKRVLVVDDVLTTGASIAECGKVLSEHGIGMVAFCAAHRYEK